MSDQTSVSDASQANSVAPEPKANDVVKYETYSRVLAEAKKLKEKVKSYEESIQQSEEQKLREQNEWKALSDSYKTQLDETKAIMKQQQESIINGLKYQAFESSLGGRLKNKDYATFIDFEKIVINPETNKVDLDSVEREKARFIKEHSSLVEFPTQAKIPNEAPKQFGTMQNKPTNEKEIGAALRENLSSFLK